MFQQFSEIPSAQAATWCQKLSKENNNNDIVQKIISVKRVEEIGFEIY